MFACLYCALEGLWPSQMCHCAAILAHCHGAEQHNWSPAPLYACVVWWTRSLEVYQACTEPDSTLSLVVLCTTPALYLVLFCLLCFVLPVCASWFFYDVVTEGLCRQIFLFLVRVFFFFCIILILIFAFFSVAVQHPVPKDTNLCSNSLSEPPILI